MVRRRGPDGSPQREAGEVVSCLHARSRLGAGAGRCPGSQPVQVPRGRGGLRLPAVAGGAAARRRRVASIGDTVAGARRYRFLAILALAQTVVGCLIIFAAVLTTFAVLSPGPGAIVTRLPGEWRERLAPAAIGGIAVAIIL